MSSSPEIGAVAPARVQQKDGSALGGDLHEKTLPQVGHAKTWTGPGQATFHKYRQTVDTCLRIFLRRGGETDDQLDGLLAKYYEPDCKVTTSLDPVGFTVKDFHIIVAANVFPAFKDFNLHFYDTSYREEGNVVTYDLRPCGHFSGVPYVFPPGMGLTPVQPPAGQFWSAAIEPVRVRFNASGKIAGMELLPASDGKISGPIGAYLKLGGKLPASSNYKALNQKVIAAYTSADPTAELKKLFAPGVGLKFGDQTLPIEVFGKMMSDVALKAFPNMKIHVKESSYEEVLHQVSVTLQVEMPHTGAPIDLRMLNAGCNDIIPASGKTVLGPEERHTILVDPRTGLVVRCEIQTLDGSIGGPIRAYLEFGGKIQQSVADRNQQTVARMYRRFATGDIQGILTDVAQDVDWLWGEESKDANTKRRLPWYGRWVGHAGVTQGFHEFGSRTDVLKFHPKEWLYSKDGNTVMALVDMAIATRQHPERTEEITLAHKFVFNEQGKLKVMREFSDTLLFGALYQ